MKSMMERYRRATTIELVDEFNSLTTAQGEASLLLQTARYTRLYRRMEAVKNELKARDGDQRRALLPLLQSRNVQVRMMAAHALLAIEPEQARRALESVRDSNVMPQVAEAGMSLRSLDEGTYLPR
ncbi:DUF2019 domain-containing protein [Rhodopseudomonas sp. HC1]|uniref:DUF2019 domain-containing protein n=1 Tax=Rhodopseudomonas infernalis TaxID=2897386 RepID=UPI001EE98CBB|nr:DUF2019 domain-containing protein [Rhodopseudomonas infernalis]MCG6203159.1 DUF2019 domain-containing protein [Rhodopseudomonas infernalis]